MSETTINAFSVPRNTFPPKPSPKGETLLKRILESESDFLVNCDLRFELSKEMFTPAADAVRQVLVSGVDDDAIFECTCILECVLREVGKPLEDSTPSGSLGFNLDYWLDDFNNVFKALGLSTLAKHWNHANVSLTSFNEPAQWPTITRMGEAELKTCLNELKKSNYKKLLPTLPEKLFTDKDDEATDFIMGHNVAQIHKWVTECVKTKTDLVFVFDGDQ